MLKILPGAGQSLGYRASTCLRYISNAAAKPPSDPLRILFCGSDEFSCASLRALHEENIRNKPLVESLDVMVLPPKRTGRGFKNVREVPCKILAEELGLSIHQRETFTNWDIPNATNLIIAVSFGLFVPPRILRSAQYGGLNVHPSFLPDLRGPAPIHHAILRGDRHAGVSLQTLDEKAFDHGTILAQTHRPGIPIPPGATVQELINLLAPIGAEMLLRGLRDGVHVPPREAVSTTGSMPSKEEPAHAPKLAKADGQVQWQRWGAEDVLRRIRVLGSVWTRAVNKKGEEKRLIIQDAEMIRDEGATGVKAIVSIVQSSEQNGVESRIDRPVRLLDDGSCVVDIGEGQCIRVRKIKEEGKPERDAANAMRAFSL